MSHWQDANATFLLVLVIDLSPYLGASRPGSPAFVATTAREADPDNVAPHALCSGMGFQPMSHWQDANATFLLVIVIDLSPYLGAS